MTAEEHNKYLAIAHLVYAGIQLLMLIMVMIVVGAVLSEMDGRRQTVGGDPLPDFVRTILVIFWVLNFIFIIPSMIAGYALLKRRSWAKIAGIVAAVAEAINFPIGTAITAYTFWFLFSDAGRQIYDKDFRVTGPQPPPPPPSDWPALRV